MVGVVMRRCSISTCAPRIKENISAIELGLTVGFQNSGNLHHKRLRRFVDERGVSEVIRRKELVTTWIDVSLLHATDFCVVIRPVLCTQIPRCDLSVFLPTWRQPWNGRDPFVVLARDNMVIGSTRHYTERQILQAGSARQEEGQLNL